MRILLVPLLVACGGGSHAKPAAPVAEPPPEKPDPYLEWHAARPKSPSEPFRTTRFEPPQQCGQGPYRLVVESGRRKFSEGMQVVICTAHSFKGSVSYVTPNDGTKRRESTFGHAQDPHHDKCRVDGVVAVTTTGGAGGVKDGAKSKPPGTKADPAATATPVAIELHGELQASTEIACPAGRSELSVLDTDTRFDSTTTAPAYGRGRVVIEIWSELPNDLAGATFFVKQRGVPDRVTAEEWSAYRRADEAWFAGYEDALARSRAAGHTWKTVEPTLPTRQPPPARAEVPTPKPSPNAAWVPGYWSDTDGWVWSAGFWRVPKEDIEQEKTVEAPAPPPIAKAEPAPQPEVAYYTARRAVWTPGYWMWNGAAYVWITGSWRIPETAGMTWVAPTWRPSRRGTAVYVPGGFIRRRVR